MRFFKYCFDICDKKKRIVFFCFVCVVCAFIFLLLLDARVRPFIYSLAENKAKTLSVQILDDSVKTVLQDENVIYNDLVAVDKTEQGSVTAIRTNMVKTNILKAEICSLAVSKLEDVREYELEIPLGALLGSDLFSGWGPNITVPITLTGRTEADFENEFVSAGVNQTLHHIWLNLCAEVYIMLPGGATKTQVLTRTEIAQTVIVGTVPGTYINAEKILTQK